MSKLTESGNAGMKLEGQGGRHLAKQGEGQGLY